MKIRFNTGSILQCASANGVCVSLSGSSLWARGTALPGRGALCTPLRSPDG